MGHETTILPSAAVLNWSLSAFAFDACQGLMKSSSHSALPCVHLDLTLQSTEYPP
jgi:hypothetical protein